MRVWGLGVWGLGFLGFGVGGFGASGLRCLCVSGVLRGLGSRASGCEVRVEKFVISAEKDEVEVCGRFRV